MHLNEFAQTASGGGLGRIPDETGQVKMHLVVETTYANLKLVRLTFKFWCHTLSFCDLWSWNLLIMNQIQHFYVAFVNVNSVKFAYSMGIEGARIHEKS